MMLRLPRKGFRLSVNEHNVSLDALIEWVEGSITFADEIVTQTDVVDILTEEEVYRSQDFARQLLETAWTEIARRQKVLGSYCPYSVSGPRISRVLEWPETAAYSYCLMLSLSVRYRDELDAVVPPDYNTQGILFERLTFAALAGRGMAVHLLLGQKSPQLLFGIGLLPWQNIWASEQGKVQWSNGPNHTSRTEDWMSYAISPFPMGGLDGPSILCSVQAARIGRGRRRLPRWHCGIN